MRKNKAELEAELLIANKKAETLEVLINYIDRYQTANQRYSMGILSEIETMENLITEILATKRNYIYESKNL